MVKVVQINVGGFDNNFSYLVIGEGKYKNEGVLIDPTGDKELIEKEITKNKTKIVLQLVTHNHFDHVELTDYFKSKGIKLFIPSPKETGEIETINVSGFEIKVLHTPGHTSDSVCYLIEDNLFSGDTIFTKGVGSLLYGGDKEAQLESIKFLSTLDKSSILWPGHNYSKPKSTLGEALKQSGFF